MLALPSRDSFVKFHAMATIDLQELSPSPLQFAPMHGTVGIEQQGTDR